jgi:hypothetical protein
MRQKWDRSWQGLHSPFNVLWAVLFVSMLLLSSWVALSAGGATQPARFEFGLIGDLPYNPEQEAKFPNLMQEINDANLAFVVHNGDFKSGASPCSDETFVQRKALFQTSKHPFIFLPGDNDWTDCHQETAGSHDPLERLAKLREVFFEGDHSLGQRTLPLTRQSNDPPYARLREHIRWTYGEVLFVGLHIVGSNNNLGRAPEADAEYRERNAATVVWLQQAFALAKRLEHKALMLIMQANPRFEDRWPPTYGRSFRPPLASQPSGFSDFLTALEAEVLGVDKPVVLVHGDTHYFRIDKPLFGATSQRMLEHFTRVETFGSPNVHWMRAIVDPNDPQVFLFKPEIVKKNLVKHGAQ